MIDKSKEAVPGAPSMAAICAFILDDAYASTFQTMGQYRTALVKGIRAMGAAPAVAVNAEAPLRGSDIAQTLRHGAGAYAQCGYCGRYSDNPQSLSRDSFPCDCGELHGWSGSFQKPTAESIWSGAAPPAESAQPADATPLTSIGPVRVGNLPTLNQEEYPGLGDWWVQLRIGLDGDEVLARVYGESPRQAMERAQALAAQPAQQSEPLAWMLPQPKYPNPQFVWGPRDPSDIWGAGYVPLYRAPQAAHAAPADADVLDAARYRKLRTQTWDSSDMFVVAGGKNRVKLGTSCLSFELLDAAVDALAASKQGGA